MYALCKRYSCIQLTKGTADRMAIVRLGGAYKHVTVSRSFDASAWSATLAGSGFSGRIAMLGRDWGSNLLRETRFFLVLLSFRHSASLLSWKLLILVILSLGLLIGAARGLPETEKSASSLLPLAPYKYYSMPEQLRQHVE